MTTYAEEYSGERLWETLGAGTEALGALDENGDMP